MTLPIAPSQTLHIGNLYDKIASSEKKRQLYCLFSSVAPVVCIEVRKNERSRGQAWVSFSSIENASLAMDKLQGFNLLGKPIKIEFAKQRSKEIAQYYEGFKEGQIEEVYVEPVHEEIQQCSSLKITDYPPKASVYVLKALFRQINDKIEVVMNQNEGFCIVKYDNPEYAAQAMEMYQNFQITDHHLKIAYYTESQ